jgi:hypothetical protein
MGFGFSFDCEVLEGITRTNYDGKESLYLGTCLSKSEKDTVITKKKTLMNLLQKVRLLI